MPGVMVVTAYRHVDFRLRRHAILARCMRQTLHIEEGKFMTRTSRTPLYRQLAAVAIALAVVAPSMPVQAQYHRPGPGWHRPPPPPPRWDNRRRGGGNGAGVAIAAGLLGVVAGVAIANSAAAASQPPPGVVYQSSAPPPPPPPGVVYYNNGAPPGY